MHTLFFHIVAYFCAKKYPRFVNLRYSFAKALSTVQTIGLILALYYFNLSLSEFSSTLCKV